MQNYTSIITNMLLNDSDVSSIFGTRIFAYNEDSTTASTIGFEGLNYDVAPSGVYDTNGVLQPTVIVYGRQITRLNDRFNRNTNRIDLQQPVEIHLNDAKHEGFGTIRTGRNYIYAALENQPVENGYKVQYVNEVDQKSLVERFNTITMLFIVRGYYIPT